MYLPALPAILLTALSVLVAACSSSSSSDSVTPISSNSSSSSSSAPYQYKGTVEAPTSITSVITGITYPYHVYLPYNYNQTTDLYPIVYGTDAQWIFPYFSQVIDARNKPVIFVGIEEGPPGSDRRAIDFLPAGAPNYIAFLKSEFIPLIENQYRTNHERTYVGTSYGGLLGAILLSKEDIGLPYFKNYLLFDGSFWALQASNIQDEETRYNASNSLPVHLILTSANNPGNVAYVDAYEQRYRNRQYQDITISRNSYNIAHNDVGNPSFDYAIDLIY